jgi:hypothetical protein
MRIGDVDVDAQDLAEQLVEVLRPVVRIVTRSPVAEADVEIAVGAEHHVAAVVVGERLPHDGEPRAPAQIESRGGIGDEGIRRRALEPRHDGVAGAIGEVDEEARVRRIRRKGETEQSLLAAGHDRAAQVEEIGDRHDTVADDADPPALLDDELHAAIGGVLNDRQRAGEPRGMNAQANRCLRQQAQRDDAGHTTNDERRDRSTGPHHAIIVRVRARA